MSLGFIDCETAVRRLWDFIDGRLPAMSHQEVQAHLASCLDCPPHFAFARELRSAVAASAQVVSADDASRLESLVRDALGTAREDRHH
jgi:anti-sigma factor RsiW